MKTEYNKLKEATNLISDLQDSSDMLLGIITNLQQESEKNGDITLVIGRSQKTFTLNASEVITLMQSKKDVIDTHINKLLAKISIQP